MIIISMLGKKAYKGAGGKSFGSLVEYRNHPTSAISL
jgi:hypothetical protein